jgi:flagellar biosynthesis/type III secretory pathway M-ring protein FliF/YscJ
MPVDSVFTCNFGNCLGPCLWTFIVTLLILAVIHLYIYTKLVKIARRRQEAERRRQEAQRQRQEAARRKTAPAKPKPKPKPKAKLTPQQQRQAALLRIMAAQKRRR